MVIEPICGVFAIKLLHSVVTCYCLVLICVLEEGLQCSLMVMIGDSYSQTLSLYFIQLMYNFRGTGAPGMLVHTFRSVTEHVT